jgi:hypothetical protein
MQLTLKTINDELARRGYKTLLAKGSGYFYFYSGEAADWLDCTVPVRTISSLTLKQWIEEFRRLKALNEQIMGTAKGTSKSAQGTRRTPVKKIPRASLGGDASRS